MSTVEMYLREVINDIRNNSPSEPNGLKLDAEIATNLDLTSFCDSLDRIDIVMTLEERYDIVIDDDLADSVKTYGDLVTLAEKLTSQHTAVE